MDTKKNHWYLFRTFSHLDRCPSRQIYPQIEYQPCHTADRMCWISSVWRATPTFVSAVSARRRLAAMCIRGSKWSSMPLDATRCWGWDLYSTALLCLGPRLAHSTRMHMKWERARSTLIDANWSKHFRHFGTLLHFVRHYEIRDYTLWD